MHINRLQLDIAKRTYGEQAISTWPAPFILDNVELNKVDSVHPQEFFQKKREAHPAYLVESVNLHIKVNLLIVFQNSKGNILAKKLDDGRYDITFESIVMKEDFDLVEAGRSIYVDQFKRINIESIDYEGVLYLPSEDEKKAYYVYIIKAKNIGYKGKADSIPMDGLVDNYYKFTERSRVIVDSLFDH